MHCGHTELPRQQRFACYAVNCPRWVTHICPKNDNKVIWFAWPLLLLWYLQDGDTVIPNQQYQDITQDKFMVWTEIPRLSAIWNKLVKLDKVFWKLKLKLFQPLCDFIVKIWLFPINTSRIAHFKNFQVLEQEFLTYLKVSQMNIAIVLIIYLKI